MIHLHAILSLVLALQDTVSEPLSQRVEALMQKHRVPGLSIAVMDQFEIQWSEAFGFSDRANERKATALTRFQAASISKPVAASGCLRLVEKGKLQLDQPVNEVLVSWQVPESAAQAGEAVTLRRLLCHGAGLTVHGFRGYAQGEEVPSLLDILEGVPPANSSAVLVDLKPGKEFRYSGGGYTLMQLVLEDVTEKKLAELLEKLVLRPLGMEHSTYQQPLPESLAEVASVGHDFLGRAIPGQWHVYPEQAAAGLWTTPSDLLRFARELSRAWNGTSEAFLKKDTVQEMLSPQVAANIGLGLFLERKNDTLAFAHGGSNEGFRCELIAFPKTGQGVAIMTNSDRGTECIAELIPELVKAFAWPFVPSL